MAQTAEEQRTYKREYDRRRRAIDPEYADRRRAASREYHRRRRAADPEWRAKNDLQAHECNLKRKYGITLAQYDALVDAQLGLCAVCVRLPRDGKRLCVDHCHDTGEIRGLLCSGCNRGIGLLGDDPELLESAAEYIRTSRRGGDAK